MGQLRIPGTSILYSNPAQVDQSTLNWQPGLTPTSQPTPQGTGYGFMAIPKPGSFDANTPEANPVLFNVQPPALSAGGVKIPNSSVVLKNPA